MASGAGADQQHPNMLKNIFMFLLPAFPLGRTNSTGGAAAAEPVTGEPESVKFPQRSISQEMASFPSLIQKSRSTASTPMIFDQHQVAASGFGGPPSVGAASAATRHLPEIVDRIGKLFGNLNMVKKSACECRRSRSMSEVELSSVMNGCGGKDELFQKDLRYQPHCRVIDNVDSCGEDSMDEYDELAYPEVDLRSRTTSTSTNDKRRGSGLDLWKNLFGGCQQEVKSDDEVVLKCRQQEQRLASKPVEVSVLQKDRQRKQERRRKNRKRRSRKKGRSPLTSDEEWSHKSSSEAGSLKDSDCESSNKRRRSKEKAPIVVDSSDYDDDDYDDDLMIAFEDDKPDTKDHRRISKTPKVPLAFGLFDEEDDETDDHVDDSDDGWDVDESDHSAEDHSELLDMLGFRGLVMNRFTKRNADPKSLSPATNCDTKSKNSITSTATNTTTATTTSCGLRSMFGCPFTSKITTTSNHSSPMVATSSAVDIPHEVYVLHYSDDGSYGSYGSMSPTDSFQMPLTEEEIERNRIHDEEVDEKKRQEAEKARLAAEAANRRWQNSLRLMKEEMGERAYILDQEFDDEKDDEESQPQPAHQEEDDIFDFEDFDQTDSGNQSSPLIESKSYPKNTKHRRHRTVRFSASPPEVGYTDIKADCRDSVWFYEAARRKTIEDPIEKVLDPVHRQRIFRERFADAAEEQ